MSAPDLIGIFPVEPLPGSPAAVEQAAEFMRGLGWTRPVLRNFKRRTGHLSRSLKYRQLGENDAKNGRLCKLGDRWVMQTGRAIPFDFQSAYMEGYDERRRERAEKASRAWDEAIEAGRAAYAATAEGGA